MFVIMEIVDGASQPVAIREGQEDALAKARSLANTWAQEPHPEVQALEDGARVSVPDVVFTVVEVSDVG